MSMQVELIAFGPWRATLAENMCFCEENYDGIEEGTTIGTTALQVETTTASRELGAALGIDPYNPGQYIISSNQVQQCIPAIERWREEHCAWQKLTNLQALANEGWTFYFNANW